MLNYNIKRDFTDQHEVYLKYLLLGVFVVGLVLVTSPLAGFNIVDTRPWLWLVAILGISDQLRRRKFVVQSSWVLLLGLLGLFSMSLALFGPNSVIYFLMLSPVALSLLLVERWGMVMLAGLTCLCMYGLTAFQVNLLPALALTLFPCLFCLLLVAVVIVNNSNVLELVYWATDLQMKDAQRAEMFYKQREQLVEALNQITHIKSKLESTNQKLEQATQRAEQASNAKSIFLSNMSHELRTPLNVIIGYSNSMLNRPQMFRNVELPEIYHSYLHLIEENGHYLVALINDILDLSKIEAGRLELHCVVVSLPELLNGVISTSIGLIKEKPLQIRPDFTENLAPIWADPQRIRQVLLNLMSNAIKFTDTGGITLHAHQLNGMMWMSVMDTGIGIPEDVLPVIFDRFQQAQHDTDRKYGGTGLGLDISKQIVQMHGGDLTVDSQVEKGTTFTFTVPLATSAQLNSEPLVFDAQAHELDAVILNPDAAKVVGQHSILIIEDEVRMREMMRTMLETAGHVVSDTHDGVQGLDLATGLMPELIILDIMLPNMDGWEVLKTLKRLPETASIPVIVCTVSDDKQKALALGASMYLEKPFVTEKFLETVNCVFSPEMP